VLALKRVTSSHIRFVHVEIVSILVFQTFDRIIFGRLRTEFSWNEMLRADSTRPTNGTRSEVWEPLI